MRMVPRFLLLGSVVGAFVLGAANAASAVEATLAPGTSACDGSIDLGDPVNLPRVTGHADGSIRWSIWADNDPNFEDAGDTSPARKIFHATGTSVDHTEASNDRFHWGCAFNPFHATEDLRVMDLTISG